MATFQAALVHSKDTTLGVDYYKYLTLLLQEMSLEMDEDFLLTLLQYFKFNVKGWEQEELLWDGSVEIAEPTLHDSGVRKYFEIIHFQPVKLNITFSRSDVRSVDSAVTQSYNPLSYFVNVLTMAIGNITDAPIVLNALIMEHAMFTVPVFYRLFSRYYSEEILGQV